REHQRGNQGADRRPRRHLPGSEEQRLRRQGAAQGDRDAQDPGGGPRRPGRDPGYIPQRPGDDLMSQWFRMYGELIHDAKVIKLSDEMFRAWVTMLCIASKNEGKLPAPPDIAAELREKLPRVATWIAGLTAAGLIEKGGDGAFIPHNWKGRQY